MAKAEVNTFVAGLITLKDMISNLKSLSNAIAIDLDCDLVYMTPQNDIHDCFAVITDPEMINASKNFHHLIINTVEAVGFNKALKKTKSTAKIESDKSLVFSTDGYDEILQMKYLEDYRDVTKRYQKLFKDKDLTQNAYNALDPLYDKWYKIEDYELDMIKNSELVIIDSSTNDEIYISKALFGNIKKTKAIYHTVIQRNENDEVVLFKQIENGFEIYHVIRFLTNLT